MYLNKNILSASIALCLLALVSSCVRDSYQPKYDNDGYMPLKIGKYILYNVDSTYWDDFQKKKIVKRSQQRHSVVDTFRDGQGRLTYTINVDSRANENEPFVSDNVVHVTPTDKFVEYNQKNLTFLSLSYPVSVGRHWNGVAKISNTDPSLEEFYTDKWDYYYESIGSSYNNGLRNFENTAVVMQIDDTLNNPDVDPAAYAYKNFGKEIFAKGVGMVRKERIYWVFQPAPGGSGYRKGYAVVMDAVKHN